MVSVVNKQKAWWESPTYHHHHRNPNHPLAAFDGLKDITWLYEALHIIMPVEAQSIFQQAKPGFRKNWGGGYYHIHSARTKAPASHRAKQHGKAFVVG